MTLVVRLFLLCLSGCCGFAVRAQTDPEADFPTLPSEPAPVHRAAEKEEAGVRWKGELGGRLQYAMKDQLKDYAFRRQSSTLSSARASLYLQGETLPGQQAQVFISGRATQEMVNGDTNRYAEGDLEQVYVDFARRGAWRLKVGRQLIALGVSDYFQVLDMVNPRDERTLGLADLKESRIPVFATRLGYEGDRSGWELIVKSEFRPHRYGRPQSDFDPFIAIGGGQQLARSEQPRLSVRPDVVLHAYSAQSWGDVHAVAGTLHDSTPMPVGYGQGGFVTAHQRSSILGVGASATRGDWVFKAELARRTRTRQMRADLAEQITRPTPVVSEIRGQTDALIGVRYTGIPGFTAGAEILGQFTQGDAGLLADPKRRQMAVINLEWSALNDTLTVGLLAGRWWDGGQLFRAMTTYDWTDHWRVGIGAILYQGGGARSPVRPYAANDRIVTTVTYSF
ncbi:hypothetical protein D8B22_12120 [Verminephrobacter aporrectodeae subsp. tuberculatae]|uniref:DUF1302 family protein n=1 Tax=Verminephrobacter aporrectodeae TaxID=1110389 RepID=UPI000237857F|nr:DUF1302 family protein [Verminephrobacter aporrectodeae]MCW5256839.1 hypothetical protein [Verminephrobacter aporrectodeae subsp. tuberculatae]MCW8164354.1 hypothetical protein [Verminephrobacter aporrectodeae subsp. tuberculatae]MCW8169833.1 hypothetical protein [Verminephrobacter aporrectodeae subsp. tuberculatae]MCW8208689.1 hypothetical protein [Verminephrobacter aporrectodeae subsp. tuberculatae]